MPSDSKKKEMQRKKDARSKKVNGTVKKDDKEGANGVAKEDMTEEETLCMMLEEEARINGNV
jgi:ATP-binding cassette, subfamily F, member 2